jgi:hypothetical protein
VVCTWAGLDDELGTADDVVMREDAGADGRFSLPGVPYGMYSCVGEDLTTGRTSPASTVAVLSAAEVQTSLPLQRAAAAGAPAPAHPVPSVPSVPSVPAVPTVPSGPASTPAGARTDRVVRAVIHRLPTTGAATGQLLALAVVLVAVGAAASAVGRRRLS